VAAHRTRRRRRKATAVGAADETILKAIEDVMCELANLASIAGYAPTKQIILSEKVLDAMANRLCVPYERIAARLGIPPMAPELMPAQDAADQLVPGGRSAAESRRRISPRR
jgi:hypothetical protein